ncbi:unnamed protein product [Arctogadus glacialis]
MCQQAEGIGAGREQQRYVTFNPTLCTIPPLAGGRYGVLPTVRPATHAVPPAADTTDKRCNTEDPVAGKPRGRPHDTGQVTEEEQDCRLGARPEPSAGTD